MVGFICATFFHLGAIEQFFSNWSLLQGFHLEDKFSSFFIAWPAPLHWLLRRLKTPQSRLRLALQRMLTSSRKFSASLQTTERMSRRQVKFCRIKSLLTSIQLKVTKIRKTDSGTVSFLSAFHSSLSFLNLFTRVWLTVHLFCFFVLSFFHSFFGPFFHRLKNKWFQLTFWNCPIFLDI